MIRDFFIESPHAMLRENSTCEHPVFSGDYRSAGVVVVVAVSVASCSLSKFNAARQQ